MKTMQIYTLFPKYNAEKHKKVTRRRKIYCDTMEKKLEGVANISLTRRRKRQFLYYVFCKKGDTLTQPQ